MYSVNFVQKKILLLKGEFAYVVQGESILYQTINYGPVWKACEITLSCNNCYCLTVVYHHHTKLQHIHINHCHIETPAVNVKCSVPVLFSFLVNFVQLQCNIWSHTKALMSKGFVSSSYQRILMQHRQLKGSMSYVSNFLFSVYFVANYCFSCLTLIWQMCRQQQETKCFNSSGRQHQP